MPRIIRRVQASIYLRFDEDQIDKENDKVVLYIFIAKVAAFAADSETNQVAIGLVIGSRVLCP